MQAPENHWFVRFNVLDNLKPLDDAHGHGVGDLLTGGQNDGIGLPESGCSWSSDAAQESDRLVS